jgi:hypothetical protein
MSESNIFAEKDRERAEYAAKWGLADLPTIDRIGIDAEARRIITGGNITDDTEKRKVYDDVKRQYLEHHKATKAKSEIICEPKDEKGKPKDDTAEFERGYKAFWRRMEEMDEFEASPYYQGNKAAEQEYLASKATKQVAIESVEGSCTDPIREELQQLKEGFKALDERLKALEKYTQE